MKDARRMMRDILPDLPEDFDRNRIVMRAKTGGCRKGLTLRLNGCDFNPMHRMRFRGFFAIPDNKEIGTYETVAERVGKIVVRGGCAVVVENRLKSVARRANVTIKEAWKDGKYVVLHMEPENQPR